MTEVAMTATSDPADRGRGETLGPRSYLAQTARLRAGQISPRDFLEQCLEAIARRDPTVRAFVQVADHATLRRAADASAERWRAGRPLSAIDGMPVAIKDIVETIDLPTGQGSPLWEGALTRRDSASVHALREAGAIIVGKSTTTEFASSAPFHETTNPHDASRTPGGSSSGSAAAVGAGMVPAALGTQVVGSILRPASFCGCVGYKPSVGGINRSGSYDHFSQSCQGVLAATLADAWAVARAISERAGGDPGYVGVTGAVDFSRQMRPARLAVLETGGWGATSEGARAAFREMTRRLAEAGVELQTRADDPEIEEAERQLAGALEITRQINEWEGRWPLNTYADLDVSKLSDAARERLANAEQMSQQQYADAVALRSAAREAFARVAARYDAAVTLAAAGAAPVGLDSTGNPIMNAAASMLGTPAISLPLLADEELPLGLQLIGGTDRDAALFAVATGLLGTVLERPELIGAPAGA
jgi:Asp-tRNA(Asn)/Glu-tRNA(Gln) amidotransferase A subunit family amidase